MRCVRPISSFLHALYFVSIIVIGVVVTYSVVFSIGAAGSEEDVFAVCVLGILAIMLWSIVYFEIRAFGSRLFMDENGVGVRHFGKITRYFRWQDIKEIGTGSIPMPYGNKTRMYLSDRILTEKEKADLATMKHDTINFSYIPEGWMEIICKNSGLKWESVIAKN